MEFQIINNVVEYLAEDYLRENWFIVLPKTIMENSNVEKFKPIKPMKKWVRPDLSQKWLIGETTIRGNVGSTTISIDVNGNCSCFHELLDHVCIGLMNGKIVVSRPTNLSRIEALSARVNELNSQVCALNGENVKFHDLVNEERLELARCKDKQLEDARLISILRERISSRDTEIISLRDDKLAMERKFIDADTSLKIANDLLEQRERIPSTSHLLDVSWPIHCSELFPTCSPRITICKNDKCVGSYKLHLVESTMTISSSHWFSVEITENAIKRMVVKWMNGFHWSTAVKGTSAMRRMPSYIFSPEDILELLSKATNLKFYITGFEIVKECDWAL